MEVGMSLNALVRLPLSNTRTSEGGLVKHSLSSSTRTTQKPHQRQQKNIFVVRAKGKKGMQARQFQRPPPLALPKIEDDGNPKFVIFIRMANVYLWYPLSLITGGTLPKAKDEKEIQKTAFKQHRVLRTATEFRYGYKIVENGNLRAALSTTDVIELPPRDELKTVLDKVKDFFGDAKESFGKLTALSSTTTEELEEKSKEKAK
ncbi:hypothetical protein CJ030_MR0G004660 [Morella rubra]|uniref:Protein HHL1, chloroplastic n=1 Tax=Morella rubra TaxID=262757 RepID=A0A6A1ULN5_9ROSI|nr:hypothetical protein CJ030_MR0G004660 [Morella rubra]